MKILMVCLGNICRSPIAEGILRSRAVARNIDVTIDSAGTSDWHAGEKPDKRAVAVARKHGIDISNLRARQFSREDFSVFDRIFVMDSSNLANVLLMAERQQDRDKVSLILQEEDGDMFCDVPDPYHGGESGFEYVFDLLDTACQRILNEIEER